MYLMYPNILLDTLTAELGLSGDDDLSRYLELPAEVIIVINERTGMPVHKIRAMIAIEPVLRH